MWHVSVWSRITTKDLTIKDRCVFFLWFFNVSVCRRAKRISTNSLQNMWAEINYKDGTAPRHCSKKTTNSCWRISSLVVVLARLPLAISNMSLASAGAVLWESPLSKYPYCKLTERQVKETLYELQMLVVHRLTKKGCFNIISACVNELWRF